VDYYHTGNSHEEWFSLDRVVLEPLEWPGSLSKAIDQSELGNYRFEVREQGSGKLLYSRGFNSVFGEWKTTDEALHGNRTFSESLRFPSPETPVEVSLKERSGSGSGGVQNEGWKKSGRRWSIRRTSSSTGRVHLAGGVDGIAENGRSSDQGGFAGAGRWLHGGGAREV
jgi:hypothetical protein